MYELALFAGAGGGLLATKWLLGWRTVCYVENASYPVQVLQARIRDGLLDDAPIWGDVRTFDGAPWRGCVDIVTAGFPCQPYSQAGDRRGENDDRNLWPDTIRIIEEIEPEWVLLENVPKLLAPFRDGSIAKPAYFGRILRDLAGGGYDVRWGCLSARAMGFDHKRNRVWIVAYSCGQGRGRVLCDHSEVSSTAHKAPKRPESLGSVWGRLARLEAELGEPSVFGTDDGLAHRVDRLKAIGNGQVPAVVAAAWRLLTIAATDD